MYKPSMYLIVTYFSTYLPTDETYLPQNWVAKVKPSINSVHVPPHLIYKFTTFVRAFMTELGSVTDGRPGPARHSQPVSRPPWGVPGRVRHRRPTRPGPAPPTVGD